MFLNFNRLLVATNRSIVSKGDIFNVITKNRSAIRFLVSSCSPFISTSRNTIKRTMSSENKQSKCLVAVCQHTCKADKDANYRTFEDQIKSAQRAGCKMMFLPECFDFICENKQQTFEQAETIDGPLISKYRELAANLKVFISLGGMHERRITNPENKVSNAHIVINDQGEIVRIYRKLHLFNLDTPGTRLVESDYSVAGECVESLVDTPAGRVGLGICYDIRFAEFAISMAKSGATILTYPSAFTVKTGIAHWEVLVKARAIENQCYVVAAAQTGIHNAKRSSFGHAMIVDPWGHIIAQVGDKSGYAIGEIDFDYLKDIRNRLPVWTDRKPQCYGHIIPASIDQSNIDKQKEYRFGQAIVKSGQVFLKTNYSFAFVNHRPLLKGHVLVSSLREVKKFTDLSADEVSDLFNTVQKVQRVLEKENDTESSTICIQDGEEAGRSIEHVHVHLLPRKADDFGGNNEKIYAELQAHDKKAGPVLSDEVMAEQANRLRSLM